MSVEVIRSRRFNEYKKHHPLNVRAESKLNLQQFNVKEFTQNMRSYIEKFGAEACMEAFRLHHWPDGGRPIDIDEFNWKKLPQELPFVPKKVIVPMFFVMQVEARPRLMKTRLPDLNL